MIDAKVEHLWAQGLIFDARVYAAMKQWLMRGLPSSDMKGGVVGAPSRSYSLRSRKRDWMKPSLIPTEALDGGVQSGRWCPISGGGVCTVSEKEGLTAAIEMFRWRGEEEEAEETRRSGVDLMFWSTLADNLGAVRALATEGNAFPGGRLKFHRPGKC